MSFTWNCPEIGDDRNDPFGIMIQSPPQRLRHSGRRRRRPLEVSRVGQVVEPRQPGPQVAEAAEAEERLTRISARVGAVMGPGSNRRKSNEPVSDLRRSLRSAGVSGGGTACGCR
jgi:hypothetical protein